MLFNASDEWQPDTLAEHEVIREPMARYLRCKQTEDLPPGTLLLLAISLYSIPRLVRPKTKERIQKLFKRREPPAQLAELPPQVSPEMLKAS
jgi:hypothetical protein